MRGYLALVVAAAAALPLAVQAQEMPRIGVIDVQRIVEESAMGKEARTRLMKLGAEKQAQGKKLADELDALRRQFTTQRATLSEAKIADLQKQIEDKQVDLARFQDDAQQQLAEAQRKEMESLEKQVMPLITELGREMKLQLIFNKYQSGLVYADDASDITDQVLRRFNTRVTK